MKYRFHGVEHEAASWVEMYTEVLKELHNGNRTYLNYLAEADDSVDLSTQVSRTPDSYSSCVKIDEGIYVFTGTSTQHKVNLLRKFFEEYAQDPAALVFFLDDNRDTGSDDEAERYKIRRKYWAQALPSIQKVSGTFKYVTSTKNNSIMGATGQAGVYVCCVANYDSARVEIFIDTGNYQNNRAVYSQFKSHRDEIEKTYGKALTWVCQDDTRACKIYDEIKEVSVKNEKDWEYMISFHSEHAAKLLSAAKKYLIY